MCVSFLVLGRGGEFLLSTRYFIGKYNIYARLMRCINVYLYFLCLGYQIDFFILTFAL